MESTHRDTPEILWMNYRLSHSNNTQLAPGAILTSVSLTHKTKTNTWGKAPLLCKWQTGAEGMVSKPFSGDPVILAARMAMCSISKPSLDYTRLPREVGECVCFSLGKQSYKRAHIT